MISAATFGLGKGGDLTVNAQDVQLIGTSANGQVSSGLYASTEQTSFGTAGKLTINTGKLLARDGGLISAATFGFGKGGDLTVNAQDVQLIGTSANGRVPSGLYASAEPDSKGAAGDLTINTSNLIVSDGGGVFARSRGQGVAGNLTIKADSIRLNRGTLSADTPSINTDPNRQQATINLRSQELILRRGSNITTNARGRNVIGGYININTKILASAENSDISANSEDYRGGNIKIDTQGIVGTQFRDQLTPESDITATGATRDLRGNVEINRPDVDPNSGLVNLPSIPVDTKIAQGCYGNNQGESKFVNAGRGGLPPNPKDDLNSDSISVDWVTLKPNTKNNNLSSMMNKTTNTPPQQIVEAVGWVLNQKGKLVITANSLDVGSRTSTQPTSDTAWQNSNSNGCFGS